MRKRNITEYTEILSTHPNEIQDFMNYNMEVVIDKVIGCSTGVVSGLDPNIQSSTGRIVSVASGIISDGKGRFFELISGTTLTLPSNSGTYHVYGYETVTNDGAISGWTLIDVETRLEDYQSNSTRTYDSIGISYYNTSSGSIASGQVLLAEVVISGSAISSLSDERLFSVIGTVASNSLQGFYQYNYNDAWESNKITGTVMDDSDPTHFKFTTANISNSHAGAGHLVNLGTNSGSSGFVANAYGNKGFIANLGSSGSTGVVINGFDNNDYGIIFNNVKNGIVTTQSSGSTFLKVNGSGVSDKAIVLDNLYEAIEINNSDIALDLNFNDIGYNIIVSGGASTNYGGKISVNNNSIGNSINLSGNTNGITQKAIEINSYSNTGTIIGFEFQKQSSGKFTSIIKASDFTQGIILNTLPSDACTGVVISGSTAGTDVGIVLKDVNKGIYTDTRYIANYSIVRGLAGDTLTQNIANQAYIYNGIGNHVEINSSATRGYGLYVLSNSDDTQDTYGFYIAGSGGLSVTNYKYGGYIKNADVGLKVYSPEGAVGLSIDMRVDTNNWLNRAISVSSGAIFISDGFYEFSAFRGTDDTYASMVIDNNFGDNTWGGDGELYGDDEMVGLYIKGKYNIGIDLSDFNSSALQQNIRIPIRLGNFNVSTPPSDSEGINGDLFIGNSLWVKLSGVWKKVNTTPSS